MTQLRHDIYRGQSPDADPAPRTEVEGRLSVIIPASNEEKLIGSCLQALAQSAPVAVPVDVIVVANGCKDATVARTEAMRPFFGAKGWSLIILDLPEGGKPAALNAGDDVAQPGSMRVYLDADVTVSPGLMSALVRTLDTRAPAYASGRVNIQGGPGSVSRAYARLWRNVPFMRTTVPGCGLFAVNAAGRARWDTFPSIISDDIFVRLQFTPAERHGVEPSYDWPIADGFGRLVKVRRRQDAGVAEIAKRYPQSAANEDKASLGLTGALKLAVRDPIGFGVYAAVGLAVRMGHQSAEWSRGR